MLKQIILTSAVVIGLVFLLVYLFQRNFIYFPDKHKPGLQEFHAEDLSIVLLNTQDNLVLSSWYKPAVNHLPTILYLHGNAGHIGYRMPLARQFIQSGLGIFLLEYRGYGGNKGKPTENGLYEDSDAALNFLIQQGINPEKIVLYGESLGTGVATKLAMQHQFCAVILQSPFTSLTSLSNYHYPWLFIKPWDEFNSLERIQAIRAPILILHGKQDEIVPYEDGLTLFNKANQPKKMISFEHQNHNNLWNNRFSEEIIRFINLYCK